MDDLSLLRCVECGGADLHGTSGPPDGAGVRCRGCGTVYPRTGGILRMVPCGSPLRNEGTPESGPGRLDDRLQADYWEDENHAFRSPRHPIVRCFAEQRWRYLASKFDVASVRTALDVGCGEGFSTLYAPQHVTITACDGSWTMLRRHPGPRRLQADAFRLPFREEAFDLVFAWELLHHVSEPYRVLGELARVSRRFVVSCEPNPMNPAQFLFALADPAHRWVLRFSRRYMLGQAERAGLRVTHFSRGGCLFPNKTPPLLFALLKRVPYRIPLVGITNCLVAEKTRRDLGARRPSGAALPRRVA